MQLDFSTTLFGRRPLTLAIGATQMPAKARSASAAVQRLEACPAICGGKSVIGIADGTLGALNAPLTSHPETTLRRNGDIVLFRPDDQVVARTHDTVPITFHRYQVAIADWGLMILRRSSPNGTRYLRKGQASVTQSVLGSDPQTILAETGEVTKLAGAARGGASRFGSGSAEGYALPARHHQNNRNADRRALAWRCTRQSRLGHPPQRPKRQTLPTERAGDTINSRPKIVFANATFAFARQPSSLSG